jgi:type I restriction enzyme, R subunit
MGKKDLSERDICTKYITPAVVNAGWDVHTQISEEKPFTDGRIRVGDARQPRGERKRADYILYYKSNIPLAILEAKDNNHSVSSGIDQSIEYAKILDLPFAYSSNGDGFVEHDLTGMSDPIEKEFSMEDFPSPEDLWERYKKWKNITESNEQIVTEAYNISQNVKKPRYYQQIAINRSVEAIAKGQKRILLVMATGTGKTYVAFQIIWRLWKANTRKNKPYRILYLADRNILIDQAMNNDFKEFKGVMTKVRKRQVDKSYEIYMALYQGVTGEEDYKNIYKDFSPDFFDLIVVDECHRGSAAADSAWREILDYYSSAAQIGMTATPKETKDVSNIDYFGEPIYTYSLRQGIEDGFLAPYKVIKVSIDADVDGWRPTRGMKDSLGREIPDKEYTSKEYDRTLVIDERTKLVSKKITEFLKNFDRFAKTIVFCVDIEHAERMRMSLRNDNSDLVAENHKYVVKITGDDDMGKKEIDNFIDPASKYPVIATTSKLLNTGVDVQTCKLVVLDSNINSMTEFKQIIGRGTRIREDYGKSYFVIMDFRRVTNLFADPDFDGEPVQILDFSSDEIIKLPKEKEPKEEIPDAQQVYLNVARKGKIPKYYVKGVSVSVLRERVQYYDAGGKLIIESLKDYTRNALNKDYRSLDEFLTKWKTADMKTALLQELEDKGVFLSELRQEVGKDFDDFDLICHVAYDAKPVTRKERAEKVRKSDYFQKYGEKARAAIDALLDKYTDSGIENIEDVKILSVEPFPRIGTPIEIISAFGGKENYQHALIELENKLYA